MFPKCIYRVASQKLSKYKLHLKLKIIVLVKNSTQVFMKYFTVLIADVDLGFLFWCRSAICAGNEQI